MSRHRAQELFKQRSEEFGISHPFYRCMPEIGPFHIFGMFKLLQTPGTIGILPEAAGVGRSSRMVATCRRTRTRRGPAIRWTAVTATRSSSRAPASTTRRGSTTTATPHTEALRITERYRRRNFGEMSVEMTFEDLKAYARPWTISLVGTSRPTRSCWNTSATRTRKASRAS